jgi:hypothetical protein
LQGKERKMLRSLRTSIGLGLVLASLVAGSAQAAVAPDAASFYDSQELAALVLQVRR